MAGRITLGTQLIFQHFQRYAALCRGLHIADINVDDLIHSRAIQHHGILHYRFQPTFGGRSPGARYASNAVLIHERQHIRHLLGVGQFHHGGRKRLGKHAMNIGIFAETVYAVFLQYFFVGNHPLWANKFF